MDSEKIKAGVRLILEGIGEDLEREGLQQTPDRVARMCEEIFAGLDKTPEEHFKVLFNAEHREMVLVKDIPFYSLCEHHLVPFFGKVHIAYIPGKDGRVCGLSKLARVVEVFARRPQLQERMTTQIVEALEKNLNPSGAMVVVEAEHMCMTMRGVQKPGTTTVTSAVRGSFRETHKTREEALSLIFH
ncbi:MAG: GTP cyclohydrolase I FolE [Coriobacteriia bacterium]|nr:GTP cyclohydrolase I FolE [Coriobacteriia bacterium]